MLSDSQTRRVQRMFRDEWDSEEELWQFLETITDPEELHLYADGFNWDSSVHAARRCHSASFVRQRHGAAGVLACAPGFYARYADRSETRNPDQADHYDLLREIEQKVMGGHFRTHRFHYDPKKDRGHDVTSKYSSVAPKRPIPPEMFA